MILMDFTCCGGTAWLWISIRDWLWPLGRLRMFACMPGPRLWSVGVVAPCTTKFDTHTLR